MQGLRTNEGLELGTHPRSSLVGSMGFFVSWNRYIPEFQLDGNSKMAESCGDSEVIEFHEQFKSGLR